MSEQFISDLIHQAGPKWTALFLIGVWAWRCTPWFGRQIEKVIDAKVTRK